MSWECRIVYYNRWRYNMKRMVSVLVLLIFAAACVFGAGQREADPDTLRVGMVTDAGTIDDKSFNQGTWEGIRQAQQDLGVQTRYLRPSGETEADYVAEIVNLYDAGYRFVVTPGFKFETAIYIIQQRYDDLKVVLLDGEPRSQDYESHVGPNTVAIYYAEHESGFLAGLATALQLKSGAVGFIGGMEIPPVQKFNWGFQQGVDYANSNHGTNVTVSANNVIYQGSFTDVPAGQQIAATMYDRGVKAIFAAAGGVGIGAINEAKSRAASGEEVWIVGVDVDQYEEGVYADGKSIILTSAMKEIGNSAYAMIEAELNGEFPGGSILTFDATNDGIGIPAENPNLSADVERVVFEVLEKMKTGEVAVQDSSAGLIP